LFAVRRCDQCQAGIHAKDLVTRVNDRVYHVDCFICASCGIDLRPGQQFRMRDGLAYCLLHYELLYNYNGYCGGVKLEATFRTEDSPTQYFGSAGGVQKGRPRKRKLSHAVETPDLPISMRLPAGAIGNIGSYTVCCSVRAREGKPVGRSWSKHGMSHSFTARCSENTLYDTAKTAQCIFTKVYIQHFADR
jgi:hypothetical protein